MNSLENGKPDSGADRSSTEANADRARRGDPGAFAHLYERLAPSLDAWARLRVSGSLKGFVEPGDVVQEVWWRAMDAFPRFDSARTGFRSWLFRIATNVLLEWNRKRRRKARLEPAQLAMRTRSLPPVLARQATSVAGHVMLRDSVRKLVEVVQAMTPNDRAVFVHCGLEGRTVTDTATLVSASPAAVEQRWRRLRNRLADLPIWREFDPAE